MLLEIRPSHLSSEYANLDPWRITVAGHRTYTTQWRFDGDTRATRHVGGLKENLRGNWYKKHSGVAVFHPPEHCSLAGVVLEFKLVIKATQSGQAAVLVWHGRSTSTEGSHSIPAHH